MREIVFGTAGHVDHGKTSLVRALTGIDTDRLKEEKERGITIELGFAFLDLPCGHRVGLVDVPGHERFVKNMVAGATGIDLVVFVVAADEGVMPQTREHFEICSLLGLKRGVVVITKKDMVDEDWLELVSEDVRAYLRGSFLDGAPMVPVSAVTGEGIEALKVELDRLVAQSVFEEAYGPFRLPVDRIFTMKGFGAVVTGTSISGRVTVGEDVMLYPQEKPAKIRGIQVHGRDVEVVEAGHRTAINLQGLDKELVSRGNVLSLPGALVPSFMLDCEFRYLKSAGRKLKNRARVRVHLGTTEVMGRVVLLDRDEAEPGQLVNVQLLLEEPVAVWPGDHYVVRSYSPVVTIGGGMVLNACPAKKRRRFKEANREIFATLRSDNPEDLFLFHLRESGYDGLTVDQLAARTGIFGSKLKKALNAPVSARRILVIDSERQRMIAGSLYDELERDCQELLARFHADNPMKEGMGKEELRSRLHQGLDPRIFQQVMSRLEKQGAIAQDGASVRLATHQVALKADEQELVARIEAIYQKAGLQPPTRKEVEASCGQFPRKLVAESLDLLVRDQRLKKVNEDLLFHAGHLTSLHASLVDFLKREKEIDAQGFKTLTGISRKFSIPLMEHFDKEKLTIRVGDKRVLRDKRGG